MNDLLPHGLDDFLAEAGWTGAVVEPLVGDASFRRYFRLRAADGSTAMLMDAPPPQEDPRPFLHVAGWLAEHGMRAPRILAARPDQGLVLLEDFGDARMRDWLDDHGGHEQAVYAAAIDALVALHAQPAGPFAPYDMAVYQREAGLFTEWYCPAMGLSVDEDGWRTAWDAVLHPLLPRQTDPVTVLRDYHAENIMLLDPAGPDGGAQGVIDFQDALVGHRAYDLVSLLQDARRDVPVELESAMLDRYCAATGAGDDFRADYARLGAQRNAKIVGIFARLWKRDGKARYLAFIPRVWDALERDLQHPALAPVAAWFAANVPQEIRDTQGGELQ
ncbi:phosphotransferase [Croceibacterium sp. TMG7-5b_MA50]|uniref:aminoglycoside phosphotransferase family protein n=1 Tax=Croceibacterium sp. TMG7-5b_MA50 TaxID=3121290 RepID=UPI0032218C08